jgi:hypothetical protein
MSLLHYIENHPLTGFALTGGHFLIGKKVGDIPAYHLPPVLIESFQVGAYSVSITVGLITVYGFYKKHFRK